MYGFDYELEPATEGIGSFFETVFKKIKDTAEKIKQFIKDVGLRIKRMVGAVTKEQSVADSNEVTTKIKEIGDSIANILNTCSVEIDRIYAGYKKVGVSKVETGEGSFVTSRSQNYNILEQDDTGAVTKSENFTDSYKKPGGMGKLDAEKMKDSKLAAEWESLKQDVGEKLAKQKGEAEKVSTKLKELNSYGPLGITATKNGYAALRKIFDANGNFGAGWKKIKIAAEWSTGYIKEALNKVVSIYDVGVRATDAFGRRLTRGFVRSDDGEKMDKADLKGIKSENKELNKIYASNKTTRNIGTKRKDANFDATRTAKVNITNESASYVLDRIYQMAYEDAMDDIAAKNAAMEAYDSVPGAYEFVEESVDPEFVLDPEYDLV